MIKLKVKLIKSAVLNVDPQNCFGPYGTCPVKKGGEIINAMNLINLEAEKADIQSYYSRDWHSQESKHFKPTGKWEKHGIQFTEDAMFFPLLYLRKDAIIISKGFDGNEDAYSPFEGIIENGQTMWHPDKYFKKAGITKLYILGLATDYCVKAAVLDARKLDYEVRVISDAIEAVDINENDGKIAIEEMRKADACFITCDQAINEFQNEKGGTQ